MKILFITDLYPMNKDEKLTPRTLHNFVIEWIKLGHTVDVIKPNFIFNSFLRGKKYYNNDFYEFEGVKIFNVNYYTPFLFDITKKIKNIDISNFDIIIAHMPSGIIFANKLAKTFNKPLVCGVHASDIEVLTNPIYRVYFHNQLLDAYKNAKKIACRSHVLQDKFNRILPELTDKTFVAPSGVEIPPTPTLTPQGWREQIRNQRILTCANLIKRKNVDKLILAMHDLEGFELKIIGSGKEEKRLKKLNVALNLFQGRKSERLCDTAHMGHLSQKQVFGKSSQTSSARRTNINFLGHLPHEKVLEEMQKADVFVLPSVNETFGMVYLEAMASGCIAVCTKDDGIDGIIKDGENGFLCGPTVEGIKTVLSKILSHENLVQIREKALDTIKELSVENCAKNYLNNV